MELASVQTMVEQMVREGRSFHDVESYVTRATLTDDEKAALWLLAWAEQERGAQRRLAEETLALVSG